MNLALLKTEGRATSWPLYVLCFLCQKPKQMGSLPFLIYTDISLWSSLKPQSSSFECLAIYASTTLWDCWWRSQDNGKLVEEEEVGVYRRPTGWGTQGVYSGGIEDQRGGEHRKFLCSIPSIFFLPIFLSTLKYFIQCVCVCYRPWNRKISTWNVNGVRAWLKVVCRLLPVDNLGFLLLYLEEKKISSRCMHVLCC